ncbi:hypothetical protein BJY01DRAFT_251762 [Aspergillus pseudoustus]|uniref:Fungal N-terminal domain-containing protein n=1 Tax=Aspergillus pseudoustus TaxID=1810923 RepID=A0ABR4J9Z3_9EURO
MSDPLSVGTGVLGVVSLGLTLAQGFLRYYGPWKDFDDEIRGFTTKVDGLSQTLRLLDGFLSPENELSLPSDQYRQLVVNNLTSCEEACRRLEKMLTECKSNEVSSSSFVRKHDWLRLKRAVYPFKKETLVTLSQLVSGLQDNLSLALQLLNGALMAQQQKKIQDLITQSSAIDIRTTKILTVVEQKALVVAEPQSIAHRESQVTSIGSPKMIEPSTLQELCDQQQLINTWLQRRRRLPSSPIDQLVHHCTCSRKPRFKSVFSFSVFALHERSCPLYVEGQQAIGITGSYIFCNRFLGRSVHFMMTLTRGAGALAITHSIRAHAVVAGDSPAFKLMEESKYKIEAANRKNVRTVLGDLRASLLRLFCEGKAAPTDRLEDGSTLLHRFFHSSIFTRFHHEYLEYWALYQELAQLLIDAGVPLNERTVHGGTALDTLIQIHSQFNEKAISEPAASFLGEVLTSGGLLSSFTVDLILHRGDWAYQEVRNMRRLFLTHPEGFEISEIETAILARSEPSLRRCLMPKGRNESSVGSPMPGDLELLYMCLSWPTGMSAILECPLRPSMIALDRAFSTACSEGEIDCALILLKYLDVITPDHLEAAAQSKETKILQEVISVLVTSRRQLQYFALQYLPLEVLRSLSLPTSALLDSNASTVYKRFTDYDIEVPEPGFESESVYNAVEGYVTAMELLHQAGFTDLNQSNEHGITPIMNLFLPFLGRYSDPHYDDAGLEHVKNLGYVATWMVSKGANVYQSSEYGYRAIWYLAENFGLSYSRGVWGSWFAIDENDIRSGLQQQDPDSTNILSLLLTDDTRDDCLCGCTDEGCTTLTRILRAWNAEARRNHKTLLAVLIDEWHKITANGLSISNKTETTHQIIRYLTFEALELTHTCHRTTRRSGRGTRLEPEEVDEIREEESLLLEELDQLVLEFKRQYSELGVGIYEFIFDYWWPRMDEIVPPEDDKPLERRRIRAAGVGPSEFDYFPKR